MIRSKVVEEFVTALAAKQSTPGGGSAAAVTAAIGAAAAQMAANYTQRPQDETSGHMSKARVLMEAIDLDLLLQRADDDAKAYQSLQSTWKNGHGLNELQVNDIRANALAVPTKLLENSHTCIMAIEEFLPACNPDLSSDAKVGIHLLAGAARAAYQTVLVNAPPEVEKDRLKLLLRQVQTVESRLLD